MDANKVTQKLRQLDDHINKVRAKIEENKKRINELQKEATATKKSLAQPSSIAANNLVGTEVQSSEIEAIKHKYKQKQDQKESEAKEKQDHNSRLENHLSHAQRVAKELKIQEGQLTEMKQKTETWLQQADKIFNEPI